MKNIVVEVNGKHAVLMNDAGDFTRIRNKNYTVGQRLEPKAVRGPAAWVKWATAAAAIVVLLFGGAAYAYNTPYTSMSLDINPSIELSTNVFDVVIGVTAVNEDAKQLLSQLRIKNCGLQTALSAIVSELVEEGYLTEEAAAELFVTSCSQDQARAQTMLQEMIRTIEQETVRNRVRANVQGECVSSELRIRAREYGVSPGKLMLAERYAAAAGNPDTVDMNELFCKSVRELMEATAACEQQNGAGSDAHGGNGYGGGNQSGNVQNAGESSQNGYICGNQTGNGYGGGDQSGSFDPQPTCTSTCDGSNYSGDGSGTGSQSGGSANPGNGNGSSGN